MFNLNNKLIYIIKLNVIFFFFGSNYILFLQNFLTNQNNLFNFFFLHVPYAWMGIALYSIIIIISIYIIFYNNYNYIVLIYIVNILCFYYLTITVVSGMIWGQLTWGSYWEWDIRLLSSFLLWLSSLILIFFFLWDKYIGILFIILSSINIPIIKYGIFWFNSLHQFNSININNSVLDIFFLFFLYNNIFYLL